ncbi:MAG: mannonate dehydratase [Pirellulaceae bacterium]
MIELDSLEMRVGLGQFRELSDERLQFIKQCGVDDFQLNTPEMPGQHRWEYEDLAQLVSRAEQYELRLMALENVPNTFWDKIMLGQPGREEQLQNMCQTVRNMGRAGIPILGYHFMPNGVWRTDRQKPVRGNALATAFHYETASKLTSDQIPQYSLTPHLPADLDQQMTDDQMWDNYDWYLERILPVCEEAGVRLALHPDDPPVPSLGGVARIFRNFDNFNRAMQTFDSPFHGLDFCHGCWSEMRGGEGVQEALECFASAGKIFYVHLRDVQGTVDDFTECFLGDGNCDPVETIRTLKRAGFRGFIIPDHVPQMVDDTDWGHRGRAYTVGYIEALIRAVAP